MKEKYSPRININGVMQHVPEIMGMELTWHKDSWEGRYYINGERHAYKRDKLKIKKWVDRDGQLGIWVHEQGGESMSLQTWLVNYGGCADYRSAFSVMRFNSVPDCNRPSPKLRQVAAGNYVMEVEWARYSIYELDRCYLYTWMCRLFGEERVAAVWKRYRVTTNDIGDVIFWYIDTDGRICHDKIVRYRFNGKRDHNFGGSRVFTTARGYTNRTLFGAHLITAEESGVKIWLCESEKTALLCSCVWPERIFVATGGKNNLRDVDERFILLPDIDAASEWHEKAGSGSVFEWWKGHEVGEKDDIGDLIVSELRAQRSVREILP